MKRIIYIILLIIILTLLYGVYFDTKGINVNEYSIESKNIPKSFNELKFVMISDILYKSSYDLEDIEDMVKEVNSLKPDIVFFNGDLLYKEYKTSKEENEELTKLFNKIDAKMYKYAIIGDNDKKYLDTYKQILNDSNFILLDDENKLLFYKDISPILIVGNNDPSKIDDLLNSEVEYSYSIVLTHKPDNFNIYKTKNIDLVLAGHSLNGQVRIPFYGGLIKRSGSKEYIDSYYDLNNTLMIVSNGMGTIKYNIRLFNRPSINLIRFNTL